MMFINRADAGRRLAKLLGAYASKSDLVVLGLPRGGVPVAFEVAAALGAPLDVFVARKLGVPGQPELAFGAIACGGVRVLNEEIVESVRISPAELEGVVTREEKELLRRERAYRGARPPLDLHGKTVILVDDGIATGASTRAAIAALRMLNPERIVLAVPVAPASTARRLRQDVDEFTCLRAPTAFYAIGEFYEDFNQVSDAEVAELLQLNREQRSHSPAPVNAGAHEGSRP